MWVGCVHYLNLHTATYGILCRVNFVAGNVLEFLTDLGGRTVTLFVNNFRLVFLTGYLYILLFITFVLDLHTASDD